MLLVISVIKFSIRLKMRPAPKVNASENLPLLNTFMVGNISANQLLSLFAEFNLPNDKPISKIPNVLPASAEKNTF